MSLGKLATVGAILSMSALLLASPAYSAPGTGSLFGTDANLGNLITVDPGTGAGTVVGNMGAGVIPSLAVDPTTGIMYAGNGGGTPNIYTVDPATGATTLVGNNGLGFSGIGGLDFRSDGTLFAAVNIAGDGGTGSDHLATIDKATGAATVIGPFGTCTGVTVPSAGGGSCSIEGIEGIAFDSSGTLWGSLSARGRAGAPGLYTINTATGTATFVAPIQDGSGAPPSGGVVSLQFGCDGTLYGGTATATSSATDGGRLITINPATGLFTFVGSVSATGGRSLGALAFQEPCPPPGAGCKVTGGGRITTASGDKATFGGNAHPSNPPAGQEQYTDHGPATPIKVHSLSVLSITCNSDRTEATITGKATINGSGSFDYQIDVKDLGEPGGNDTYRIRLSNGYDSGQQTLNGGNIQIHKN